MSYRIHHNSNSESGGNRLYLTDDDIRQPDFKDQVSYRLKDFASPSRWLGFLKIATASDLGKHAVRFGAQVAGVKSAKMLMLLGRLGDEAVGSSMTYQYRSEDGARAFWYEMLDGLTIWATSVSSMAALTKLGWLAGFGKGQQFLLRTALMGLGMLVGERLTKALGSKRPVIDNLWEGGALAFLDALSVGVMGASFRRVGLDVDTHVSRYTHVVAGDKSSVPGERGRVVRGQKIRRPRTLDAYYIAMKNFLDQGFEQAAMNMAYNFLRERKFFPPHRPLLALAMDPDVPMHQLKINNSDDATSIRMAMHRLHIRKTGHEKGNPRLSDLYQRLEQAGYADLEALCYRQSDYDQEDRAAELERLHIVNQTVLRYLSDADFKDRVVGSLSECYHFNRLILNPYSNQEPLSAFKQLAHQVAKAHLVRFDYDKQDLNPKQKFQAAQLYHQTGQVDRARELMEGFFNVELFRDGDFHDEIIGCIDYMSYLYKANGGLIPHPKPYQRPVYSSMARGLAGSLQGNNLKACLPYFDDADLQPACIRALADSGKGWIAKGYGEAVKMAVGKVRQLAQEGSTLSLYELHSLYECAIQVKDDEAAAYFKEQTLSEGSRLKDKPELAKPQELFYAADIAVREKQFRYAGEIAASVRNQFYAWALPDEWSDQRDFFKFGFIEELVGKKRYEEALKVLDELPEHEEAHPRSQLLRFHCLRELGRDSQELGACYLRATKIYDDNPQFQDITGKRYMVQLMHAALAAEVEFGYRLSPQTWDRSQMTFRQKLDDAGVFVYLHQFSEAYEVYLGLHRLETWQDPRCFFDLPELYQVWGQVQHYLDMQARERVQPDLIDPVTGENLKVDELVFRPTKYYDRTDAEARRILEDYAYLIQKALPIFLECERYDEVKKLAATAQRCRVSLNAGWDFGLSSQDYQARYFLERALVYSGMQGSGVTASERSGMVTHDSPKDSQDLYYACLWILDGDSSSRGDARFKVTYVDTLIQQYTADRASPALRAFLNGHRPASGLSDKALTQAVRLLTPSPQMFDARTPNEAIDQVTRELIRRSQGEVDIEWAHYQLQLARRDGRFNENQRAIQAYEDMADFEANDPDFAKKISPRQAYHFASLITLRDGEEDKEEFIASYLGKRYELSDFDGEKEYALDSEDHYYLAQMHLAAGNDAIADQHLHRMFISKTDKDIPPHIIRWAVDLYEALHL